MNGFHVFLDSFKKVHFLLPTPNKIVDAGKKMALTCWPRSAGPSVAKAAKMGIENGVSQSQPRLCPGRRVVMGNA